ncbi:MAG: hypothetical protein LC122_14335 [Chitinophagales bacterium]|nr:hypothetical protein [Chitinophagales bacterium]
MTFNIKNFDLDNQLCIFCDSKLTYYYNCYQCICSNDNNYTINCSEGNGHIISIYMDKHTDSYFIYIIKEWEILNIKVSNKYNDKYLKQFFVDVTEITDYEKLRLLIEKIYKMIELE